MERRPHWTMSDDDPHFVCSHGARTCADCMQTCADDEPCTCCGGRPATTASSTTGPLIDPDCRDRKHATCTGGPCECPCHEADGYWFVPSLDGAQ